MRNIHLIPTDKPSRLGYLSKKGKEVFKDLRLYTRSTPNILDSENQHLYITNDEEIKEGDYVCASGGVRFVKTLNKDRAKTFKDDGIISKQSPSSSCHLSNYKKIILTTDQDLIKDGVQVIDDEFLEWFVKNPSCEWIEIIDDTFTVGEMSKLPLGTRNHKHKIITPKEELSEYSFKDGKWQAERMYSEEDLKTAYFSAIEATGEGWNGEYAQGNHPDIKSVFNDEYKKWFEQFNKK